MTHYVYDFDEESAGGRELLGGKGVGLAEMTALVGAQRAYEADEKAAQRADETLRRAVTDVPTVRS